MAGKQFIERHQDIVQLCYFAFIILSLWGLEALLSSGMMISKMKHTKINLAFIITALPVQLLMISIVLLICDWTNLHHWGLIYSIPFHNNFWMYYISLFILMDFCEYVYHVIMHKLDFLWKFHLVHHSDLKVDVSTTLREHPGETFVRTSFMMLWVFLLGPLSTVLVLRQTVQTFSNIAAHTEFRLPAKLNKIVGWVFITPNLHHVHHHYQLPFTDRNYGDVLSIWDRIFGTYAELDAAQTIYGVDTHMEPEINSRFFNILKIPFKKLIRK